MTFTVTDFFRQLPTMLAWSIFGISGLGMRSSARSAGRLVGSTVFAKSPPIRARAAATTFTSERRSQRVARRFRSGSMPCTCSPRCHGVAAKELQRQLGGDLQMRVAHVMNFASIWKVDGETPLGGVVEVRNLYRWEAVWRQARTCPQQDGCVRNAGTRRRRDDKGGPKGSEENATADHQGTSNRVVRFIPMSLNPTAGFPRPVSAWTVNHGAEYVDGDCHVNGIEGFWARLKLSIRGTHVHVSRKHLQTYVKEFEYRYNMRQNPGRMFAGCWPRFSHRR